MSYEGSGKLVHLLRNISVRELMRALERDGFVLQRTTRTGGHIYQRPEGRCTLIHYHQSIIIEVVIPLTGKPLPQ